jgi:hypothetical protein
MIRTATIAPDGSKRSVTVELNKAIVDMFQNEGIDFVACFEEAYSATDDSVTAHVRFSSLIDLRRLFVPQTAVRWIEVCKFQGLALAPWDSVGHELYSFPIFICHVLVRSYSSHRARWFQSLCTYATIESDVHCGLPPYSSFSTICPLCLDFSDELPSHCGPTNQVKAPFCRCGSPISGACYVCGRITRFNHLCCAAPLWSWAGQRRFESKGPIRVECGFSLGCYF